MHETESREYTLDDFYTLNLEKRDGFVTLRASGIDEEEWYGTDDDAEDGPEDGESEDESSSDDDGDDFIEEKLDEDEQGEDDGEAAHAALTAAEKVRSEPGRMPWHRANGKLQYTGSATAKGKTLPGLRKEC